MNKKGVIDQLTSLIAPIIVIAVVLTVGFLVLNQMKDNVVGTESATVFLDTTKTITIDTFTTFSECIHDSSAMTIQDITNDTSPQNVSMNAGNFTVVLNTINVSDDNLGPGVGGLATSVSVNYTCFTPSLAYNATSETQSALGSIPGWLPIIIITIIGALLISLVAVFRRR